MSQMSRETAAQESASKAAPPPLETETPIPFWKKALTFGVMAGAPVFLASGCSSSTETSTQQTQALTFDLVNGKVQSVQNLTSRLSDTEKSLQQVIDGTKTGGADFLVRSPELVTNLKKELQATERFIANALNEQNFNPIEGQLKSIQENLRTVQSSIETQSEIGASWGNDGAGRAAAERTVTAMAQLRGGLESDMRLMVPIGIQPMQRESVFQIENFLDKLKKDGNYVTQNPGDADALRTLLTRNAEYLERAAEGPMKDKADTIRPASEALRKAIDSLSPEARGAAFANGAETGAGVTDLTAAKNSLVTLGQAADAHLQTIDPTGSIRRGETPAPGTVVHHHHGGGMNPLLTYWLISRSFGSHPSHGFTYSPTPSGGSHFSTPTSRGGFSSTSGGGSRFSSPGVSGGHGGVGGHGVGT